MQLQNGFRAVASMQPPTQAFPDPGDPAAFQGSKPER
jgi:hypothetical protein